MNCLPEQLSDVFEAEGGSEIAFQKFATFYEPRGENERRWTQWGSTLVQAGDDVGMGGEESDRCTRAFAGQVQGKRPYETGPLRVGSSSGDSCEARSRDPVRLR